MHRRRVTSSAEEEKDIFGAPTMAAWPSHRPRSPRRLDDASSYSCDMRHATCSMQLLAHKHLARPAGTPSGGGLSQLRPHAHLHLDLAV